MNPKRVYVWPNPSEERLRELKDMEGVEYWATPEWRSMRAYIIARDGRRCKVCNADQSLSVHHRTYNRGRGRELPDDLVTLCAACHGNFHSNRRLFRPPTKKQQRRKKAHQVERRKAFHWDRVSRIMLERKADSENRLLDKEYCDVVG